MEGDFLSDKGNIGGVEVLGGSYCLASIPFQ